MYHHGELGRGEAKPQATKRAAPREPPGKCRLSPVQIRRASLERQGVVKEGVNPGSAP